MLIKENIIIKIKLLEINIGIKVNKLIIITNIKDKIIQKNFLLILNKIKI